MSRKDFMVIADAFKECIFNVGINDTERVAHEMATALEDNYPNFNRRKFFAYIGIQDSWD